VFSCRDADDGPPAECRELDRRALASLVFLEDAAAFPAQQPLYCYFEHALLLLWVSPPSPRAAREVCTEMKSTSKVFPLSEL
jgi:hypothetical protein